MIMIHGDDKGLVLPPKVASVQVVITPIIGKDKKEEVAAKGDEIFSQLKAAGVRVKLDDRDLYKPGFKYAFWELKGVPLRIEIGAKDIDQESVMVARRDTGNKTKVAWSDLQNYITTELETMQTEMLERARAERDSRISKASDWTTFMAELNKKQLVLAPWCEAVKCEEEVNDKSKAESLQAQSEGEEVLTGAAKTLCLPAEQDPLPEGTKCFCCDEVATKYALWGRSY